jgi:hypothetical protein
MHGLSIRTFTELSPATGSFTRTQYAAETPGAKVGGSVFVDLDAYQFSPNPFLDNSRVTDAPRMSFSPPSKADPERMADFCNRQSAI